MKVSRVHNIPLYLAINKGALIEYKPNLSATSELSRLRCRNRIAGVRESLLRLDGFLAMKYENPPRPSHAECSNFQLVK